MATKTIDLLDRLSKKLEGASDYAIAKHLNVTHATVSRWRNGKGSMSDETAIAVADLLGEDEGFVLLEIAAERATSESAKKLYRRIAGTLRRTAAMFLFAIAAIFGLFSHSPTAKAASYNTQTLHIMVNIGWTEAD